MLKVAIIIFRECLEIALLLGVIMAVTKPIANSRFYVILGVLVGVVLASVFAFFTQTVSVLIGGFGDELVDAAIILTTSVIIIWTVVWMQGYTQKIKKDFGELSDKINSGTASKFMLVIVIASTILREGVEILLYIYSISSAEDITINEYIWGLGLGGAGGFLVGIILYNGLIKYAGRYIFKISTILLILIAAGLSSEAANILTSAGFIDILTDQLWDTSWIIDDSTILGKVLKITTGYDAKPNGMQLIFYIGTIIFTLVMIKLRSKISIKKVHNAEIPD